MTERWGLLNFIAGLIVAFMVALVVLVPQLIDARADRARLQTDREVMEQRCTFYTGGSATCPAGTFTKAKP